MLFYKENKLLHDIEYFITYCSGDPTIEKCISLVKTGVENDDLVKIITGKPSSYIAFNEMIDQSKTKYAFQIDGDQFMYDGFVDRVEKATDNILEKKDKVCMLMFSSYDSFEERNIWASAKLYNMDVLRKTKVRFKNTKGCDRLILKELSQNGGYSYIPHDINNPIAIHALRESGPKFVFSRFQNRILKDGINCNDVQRLLGPCSKKYKESKDMCSAAFFIACITPYHHEGEVSRSLQETYPERQWFDNVEGNLSLIDAKVQEAMKKLRVK